MLGWLKCPMCGDVYELDPNYEGPVDEDGFGVSEYFCLNCWDMYFALPVRLEEDESDDELQVSAVCCEASRVSGDDHDGRTDDDSEGDGDDSRSHHDPNDDWYANERTHRFDHPIDD